MTSIALNNKSYSLDFEKALELGVLKEQNLPKTWEEYYSDLHFENLQKEFDDLFTLIDQFNVLSIEESSSLISFLKLFFLQEVYRAGWKPDWNSSDQFKYCIVRDADRIHYDIASTYSRVLAFPTQKMCCEFYETFKPLIEEAKLFL